MTQYLASVFLRGTGSATGGPGDWVGRFSFTLPPDCRSRVVEMIAENHVLELGYLPVWGGAVLRAADGDGERRAVDVFVERRSLVRRGHPRTDGRGAVWCEPA